MSEPQTPGYFANLWAPWRMAYIDSLSDLRDGCFLCDYWFEPERDVENYVLWRGESTLTLLNRFPYSGGHVLVAPSRHVESLEELSDTELHEVMEHLRDAKLVLQRSVGAQGFNVGFNLGHCAGAGLPGHLHGHLVPRWGGDTNYMTVIGDAKVMPIALERIAQGFRDVAAEMSLPA